VTAFDREEEMLKILFSGIVLAFITHTPTAAAAMTRDQAITQCRGEVGAGGMRTPQDAGAGRAVQQCVKRKMAGAKGKK
jgi:hypothetical protein